MPKETINTTNKFTLPSSGDVGSDEARRQIVENLQKITPEDIQALSKDIIEAQEWGNVFKMEYDDIYNLNMIGGKLVFVADIGGETFVMWGKEKILTDLEINSIKFFGEVGGKPLFTGFKKGKSPKDRKRFIIRGDEKFGEDFDVDSDPIEIGGKPVFIAGKYGKRWLMQGNEKISDEFEYMADLVKIGGKPAYSALSNKDSQKCIMRGDEKFEEVGVSSHPIEIGGKPAFKTFKNGKQFIMWGGEKYSQDFDSISDPIDIGGIPVFAGCIIDHKSKQRKRSLMRGEEKYSQDFDYINPIREFGGKPAFGVSENGKSFIVLGKERMKETDYMETRPPVELGGKLGFRANKDGKFFVMLGDEKIGGDFDNVSRPVVIGGNLVFSANQDGKDFLMIGDKQYGPEFDDVRDIVEIGGKPAFTAKKDGKWHIYR